MNKISLEDGAVFSVEICPLFHHLLGFLCVVEPETSVACLDASSEVLSQGPLIGLQVLLQGLEGRRFASPVVLHQGQEHPPLARDVVVSVDVHSLPTDADIHPPGKRKLALVIAHTYTREDLYAIHTSWMWLRVMILRPFL